MTRRKHEGGNVTLHPVVAPNHFDGLEVSPRPYCSAAFKAAVERAATMSGGKIPVTVLDCQQPLEFQVLAAHEQETIIRQAIEENFIGFVNAFRLRKLASKSFCAAGYRPC